MSKVIYYNALHFQNNQSLINQVPGLNNLNYLYDYINHCSFMDRTGSITLPFECEIVYKLPDLIQPFNLSFEQCVELRMQELDKLHQVTGKKFRLLYSGGIDSTSILAAFIGYYGLDRAGELVEISCTKESIDENPWVWDRYIAPGKFKLLSAQNYTNHWVDNVITINGELSDQLFGIVSMSFVKGWMLYNKQPDKFCKITPELCDEYFEWWAARVCESGDAIASGRYFSKLVYKIGESAPWTVNTMYSLLSWFSINTLTNGIVLRMLSSHNGNKYPEDFLETRYKAFFNTPEFQRLGIDYNEDITPDKFGKPLVKNFILTTLNIPEYASKGKFGSWPRVHSMIPDSAFIDNNLELHNNVMDIINFVNPTNSFL